MKIVDMPIAEISPYFRNPRKIDKAVEPVKESIREFGFKQPIVVDKDGTIIIGHVRFTAAKELGMTEVPVVVADTLTEEDVKALRLIDNKSRELSEWDFDKLEYEYARIVESGLEMGKFGLELNLENILEKENEGKEQNLNGCEEFELSDFDEEVFDYCCPKCGMRFNKK